MMGGIFILLMVGLVFTASSGVEPPFSRQISNAEASTIDLTDNQGALLALMLIVVPGLIVGMAIPMYILLGFLNKNVAEAQQRPPQPMNLLAPLSSAGSEATNPAEALNTTLADNAMLIVAGLGGLMVVITLIVILAA